MIRSAVPLLTLLLLGAGDEASQPVRWTLPALSTVEYESSPTFGPDGTEIIFMRADRQFRRYRLLRATCGAGGWSAPEPLPFAAAPPAMDADPFLTRDGRRLYFVSTRQAPADEQFDIWYADRDRAGRWHRPVRLPAPVNSAASELLPRMDDAGNLYFGSDRPGGHGQSDIYAARQRTDGWIVRNLDAPVSTAANEYEAEVSRNGRTLIVVADRGDRSHLYRFRRKGAAWREVGRIAARPNVFQVGPVLSPRADRLLFAQEDGDRSGEIFAVALSGRSAGTWPRPCRATRTSLSTSNRR